nr:MAK10-like protein [Tanacetum cinerariifolium]
MATCGRKKSIAEPAPPTRDPRDDSLVEKTETESNVWDNGSEDVNPFGGGNLLLTKKTESEPIIWDIGDEEEEYPFVNKHLSFQEEPIMLGEEEPCPVYDTDNEEGKDDDKERLYMRIMKKPRYLMMINMKKRFMGDENPIHTLKDYSKPSHEGYRNTIELPEGNNVVPLRSETIWLVQNGCSFHGIRSEDPNQHLKDFLKLVDSLDLDGSISTWKDLTTSFLAQFFPPGRTVKLRNDILMDFSKPVKEIALPQDVPSTSDRHLIELENQVQRLMEAYLTPTRPTQVNKITTQCEICSGPHDTQNCMEIPEQAFVDYVSSHINETGSKSNVSTPENAGTPMVLKSIAATNHDEREELKKKEIKIPSKLLSPKYLFPASVKELNKNPSAPKHVHFVNSIIILSTESDTDDDDTSSTRTHKHKINDMVKRSKEIKDQSKEEDEMKTRHGSRRNTSSIIDRHLGEMVFEKPFIDETGLVYSEENGTVMFKQGNEKITFKMPYTMEIFKLYLMRRSLKVGSFIGGRFNQLSHVSSPLLSKPG